MSILSTAPVNTRTFDMEIAAALGSMEAAIILQQLHYWTQKEGVGVIIEQAKYIYNTFEQWVENQFTFLSKWKFRKAMGILRSLSIVKVIRYKSKQWNQTNYYSLDYGKLREWGRAESIEISEMRSNTPQEQKERSFKMQHASVSLEESKITNHKKLTAKQKSDHIELIAAADIKNALEAEKTQKQSNHSRQLTTVPGQSKPQSSPIKLENQEARKASAGVLPVKAIEQEEGNVARVDYIVNYKWKELIPELDVAGIAINKTMTSLLKMYSAEEVENAIALLKVRKRERHIPNLAGYFTAVLEGGWGSKNIVEGESGDREIDTASIFRHWYDLARELGYCQGQEIREGEQWICLSGSWERWENAVNRGYSLEYLKKIMRRNQG